MENSDLSIERFPALDQLGYRNGFIARALGIKPSHDKATALTNLDEVHGSARRHLDLDRCAFATARQVHGDRIAIVKSTLKGDCCFENSDGVIANQSGVCVGIYVADCCAVYLADRRHRAFGLVHSGKKGTELQVVAKAIALLRDEFSVAPHDLVVQLSPCIRPPHYEVDFASQIVGQCRAAGVEEVHDEGRCTACDLTRYYSYRAEKGRTGRMLALLALPKS